MLTSDQVRHIAKLARLRLSDSEVEKFSKELTSILQYVDMLKEVDTSKVEATAQVTGLSSVFREDTVITDGPSTADLLGCSPLAIIEQQIQTPSAHG